MGACASVVGGASPVDAAMLLRIGDICAENLKGIPDAVYTEKNNIVWEMWRKSWHDKVHEVELPTKETLKFDYKEYPENETKVAQAAVQIACANTLKDTVCAVVHEALDGVVHPKFPSNPMSARLMRAAYDKAVEKSAEKAVDKAIEKALAYLKEKGVYTPTDNGEQAAAQEQQTTSTEKPAPVIIKVSKESKPPGLFDKLDLPLAVRKNLKEQEAMMQSSMDRLNRALGHTYHWHADLVEIYKAVGDSDRKERLGEVLFGDYGYLKALADRVESIAADSMTRDAINEAATARQISFTIDNSVTVWNECRFENGLLVMKTASSNFWTNVDQIGNNIEAIL
eukprot:GILK01000158.1.p1 GENE.GILK01000158.1~~GILK01000158.1.p1  ORF type:complete len:364 (-),score=90.83 GILK01000158.1:175-1194(-)